VTVAREQMIDVPKEELRETHFVWPEKAFDLERASRDMPAPI
jgi:hypothetical protein